MCRILEEFLLSIAGILKYRSALVLVYGFRDDCINHVEVLRTQKRWLTEFLSNHFGKEKKVFKRRGEWRRKSWWEDKKDKELRERERERGREREIEKKRESVGRKSAWERERVVKSHPWINYRLTVDVEANRHSLAGHYATQNSFSLYLSLSLSIYIYIVRERKREKEWERER